MPHSLIAVVVTILGFCLLGAFGVLLAYGWSCHRFYVRSIEASGGFQARSSDSQNLPEHWKTLFLEELRVAAMTEDSILLPSEVRVSVKALAGLLERLRLLCPEEAVRGASVDAWWRFATVRRHLGDREAFIQTCSQAILYGVHVMGKEKPEGDRCDSGC